MTPEELAREALYGFSAFTGGTLQAIEGAIRSALAERDAQWREALERSHYDSIDGLHLDDPPKGWRCDDCAPLRALLDAAARSANKAVSAAADPE